eukprot:UN27914
MIEMSGIRNSPVPQPPDTSSATDLLSKNKSSFYQRSSLDLPTDIDEHTEQIYDKILALVTCSVKNDCLK